MVTTMLFGHFDVVLWTRTGLPVSEPIAGMTVSAEVVGGDSKPS